jgi:hypothetical protein
MSAPHAGERTLRERSPSCLPLLSSLPTARAATCTAQYIWSFVYGTSIILAKTAVSISHQPLLGALSASSRASTIAGAFLLAGLPIVDPVGRSFGRNAQWHADSSAELFAHANRLYRVCNSRGLENVLGQVVALAAPVGSPVSGQFGEFCRFIDQVWRLATADDTPWQQKTQDATVYLVEGTQGRVDPLKALFRATRMERGLSRLRSAVEALAEMVPASPGPSAKVALQDWTRVLRTWEELERFRTEAYEGLGAYSEALLKVLLPFHCSSSIRLATSNAATVTDMSYGWELTHVPFTWGSTAPARERSRTASLPPVILPGLPGDVDGGGDVQTWFHGKRLSPRRTALDARESTASQAGEEHLPTAAVLSPPRTSEEEALQISSAAVRAFRVAQRQYEKLLRTYEGSRLDEVRGSVLQPTTILELHTDVSDCVLNIVTTCQLVLKLRRSTADGSLASIEAMLHQAETPSHPSCSSSGPRLNRPWSDLPSPCNITTG